MLQVDLHSHTNRSQDGVTTPEELVERARAVGLDRIAVTDHGTIDGALRARETGGRLVIVGEEIRCRCRTELIGLFLTERIPMNLPMEAVIERIADQGGVIYAPHPFAYATRPCRRARLALSVADAVEVLNARAFLPWWNRAAARAAAEIGLPALAGSDAHFPFEIGRAFVRMPAFDDAAQFRRALPEAHPFLRDLSSPLLHVASMGVKCARVVQATLASRDRPNTTSLRPATAGPGRRAPSG